MLHYTVHKTFQSIETEMHTILSGAVFYSAEMKSIVRLLATVMLCCVSPIPGLGEQSVVS